MYKIIPVGKAEDISGKEYGRLTAVSRVEPPQGLKGVYWLFHCQCGNDKVILANNVKRGRVKSCGCYNNGLIKERIENYNNSSHIQYNFQDLTGKEFGNWLVLEQDKTSDRTKWICQCKCGTIKSVYASHLTGGKSTSCGCLRHNSKGEEKIIELLQTHNICFIKQYSQTINNKQHYFDFFIDGKYFIEYDGYQHFQTDNPWYRPEPDKEKNEWCKENHIPLIRIPYTQLEELSIDDLKLDTTQFLIS